MSKPKSWKLGFKNESWQKPEKQKIFLETQSKKIESTKIKQSLVTLLNELLRFDMNENHH